MEHVLSGESDRRIVRIGDTLRRPMYPWSPSVHLLLQHLESVGFDRAPRFLGIDEEGREVLTFIEGVSGADGYVEGVTRGAEIWAMVADPAGLARFARLLREFHDATAGFSPPPEAPWATGCGAPSGEEVMCHLDIGPWNVVWRDGVPVGIIDWDYAAPAPRLADIGYALDWSVPFCSDEECVAWRRFDTPPDRPARIEIFADAYGLDSSDGLVDAVLRSQYAFYDREVALAARGIEPHASGVAGGYLDWVTGRIRWTESSRSLLE